MNEKVLQLPDLMSRLSNKMEQLKFKAIKIEKQIQPQNDKFDKLWKGYHALGLLDNLEKMESPITREIFIIEFNNLQNKLNEKLVFYRSNNDKNELRDALEKQIITILYLLSLRWWSISEFLKLWSNRRLGYRENELKLMSDYEKLENEHNIELFMKKTDSIANKQIELIEKQLELITAEDELYVEMEDIYIIREKLFTLSTELFAI